MDLSIAQHRPDMAVQHPATNVNGDSKSFSLSTSLASQHHHLGTPSGSNNAGPALPHRAAKSVFSIRNIVGDKQRDLSSPQSGKMIILIHYSEETGMLNYFQ